MSSRNKRIAMLIQASSFSFNLPDLRPVKYCTCNYLDESIRGNHISCPMCRRLLKRN